MQGRVTQVKEEAAVTQLSVDALTGATSIEVDDLSVFDWQGGQVLIGLGDLLGYTIDGADDPSSDEISPDDEPDADGGTLLLDAPLSADYDAGTLAGLYPPVIERTAYVISPDQEEEIGVRVPHALYNRLLLGPRDQDTAESIEYERIRDEHVAGDVLGEQPVIDSGFYIGDPSPNRGYDEVLSAENTTSTVVADLATPGPSVGIVTAENALVQVFAQVDIKANGGGQGDVMLYLDGVPIGDILESVSAVFQTFWTSTAGVSGGVTRTVASPLTLSVSEGEHVFELRYFRVGGTSADFRNRKIWAWVLGQ